MTTGAWAAAVTAMKMAGENGVEVMARVTVMTETAMERGEGKGGGEQRDDGGGDDGQGQCDGESDGGGNGDGHDRNEANEPGDGKSTPGADAGAILQATRGCGDGGDTMA